MQRPPTVTVIGWIFIALGALMLFGALFALGGWYALPMAEMRFDGDASFPVPMVAGMFRWFGVMALAQALVAAAMIGGGSGLLALRPWSRPLLEGISWLALVWLVGFAILWVATVTGIARQIPQDEVVPSISVPFMLFTGLAGFAVPAALPIVMIWALRRPSVRSALDPATA